MRETDIGITYASEDDYPQVTSILPLLANSVDEQLKNISSSRIVAGFVTSVSDWSGKEVSLPAGVFSEPPIVIIFPTNFGVQGRVSSVTASKFTVKSGGNPENYVWLAVQIVGDEE